MKRIGLITWHYYNNFGSRLQAFALLRVVSNLGYNARFINYRNAAIELLPTYKRVLISVLLHLPYSICKIINNRIDYTSLRFEKDFLTQSKLFADKMSLKKEASGYDSIICGSDQIWAPNVYNPIYMLDFVPNEVNKISYAASIGLDSIPVDMVENYKKYIGRINHVSVREDKGKEILKKQCGIDATVVLDPTLMLPKPEWDKIKKLSKVKEKYIFCYFLKKDHQYKDLVKDFAKNKGYAIYGVSDNSDDASWMHLYDFRSVGPCEFIGLIEGSEGIFTDSYHGTIFSMIYHKPFTLFERFNSSDKICQNSRIEQLKKYFGIDENVVRVDSLNTVKLNPVDYEAFEKSLALLREHSMSFLKNALK